MVFKLWSQCTTGLWNVRHPWSHCCRVISDLWDVKEGHLPVLSLQTELHSRSGQQRAWLLGGGGRAHRALCTAPVLSTSSALPMAGNLLQEGLEACLNTTADLKPLEVKPSCPSPDPTPKARAPSYIPELSSSAPPWSPHSSQIILGCEHQQFSFN